MDFLDFSNFSAVYGRVLFSLFAIYVNSFFDVLQWCYIKLACLSIVLYADDILLIAPSVTALQQLFVHVNRVKIIRHVCKRG